MITLRWLFRGTMDTIPYFQAMRERSRQPRVLVNDPLLSLLSTTQAPRYREQVLCREQVSYPA